VVFIVLTSLCTMHWKIQGVAEKESELISKRGIPTNAEEKNLKHIMPSPS